MSDDIITQLKLALASIEIEIARITESKEKPSVKVELLKPLKIKKEKVLDILNPKRLK